ncbi:MAG: hypothetical protein K9J79_07385 [Desulfobacteraceae bacterium]|nr:hypothetical protein [Desulfobacteraceae bacterium]MCF8095173.1 hypothetical protein [Desulfobacteraceae bacterium]
MWNEKNINGFLAVFFAILVMGFLVHQDPRFAGSALGHSLGIVGSIFILMTLIYPFRKKVLKKQGKQNPLNTHITYGLVGPTLVVIHSGHKLESLIGILIFLSLVVVVLSGIVGRYLFKKVNRSLKEQKRDHSVLKERIENRKQELFAACSLDDADNTAGGEMTGSVSGELMSRPAIMDECGHWLDEVRALAETEYSMKFFNRLKTIFTQWIRIHYIIAAILFAMLIVHVLTTLYYGFR